MADPDRTHCPACQTQLVGRFCHRCGEKAFSPEDLSGRAIGRHVLESVTEVDGKLLTSIRLMLTRPGQLTLDYLRGIRKNRLTPFQILILINVVYFIVVGLLGYSPFTTQLQTHTTSTNFFHRALAEQWVADYVASSPLTMEQYTDLFNAKVDLYAKSLVVLFVPYFIVVLALMNWGRQRRLVGHLVMATHLTSYMLLILMVVAPTLNWVMGWLYQAGWLLLDGYYETVYSGVLFGLIGFYYYLLINRVYGGFKSLNAIRAVLMILFVNLGFLLYRVVLFFVGYYSI